MDQVNVTPLSYVIIAIVAYYLLLFCASLFRGRQPEAGSDSSLVVIVVPACDEELVIRSTLENLTSLSCDGDVRIVVVDDASEDSTAAIVEEMTADDPRIRLLRRCAPIARTGKSGVLNHAFHALNRWQSDGDPFLAGQPADRIVVGVVDADGCLDPDTLDRVLPYFGDPEVGQVQIGVTIANRGDGFLERLQDIEFVGFSGLVQVARDHVGSPGLGGNGQFTRLVALRSLGGEPWQADALTEDLALGLRLVTAGWRTRFCPGVFVHQQGLDRWRPLLRQRTRWIQGHYQCWRYIPALLRSRRGTSIVGRLDLIAYLLLVISIVAVFASGAVAFTLQLCDVPVVDHSLDLLGAGFAFRLVSLLLCCGPLITTMYAYQRLSPRPLRSWELPAFCVMFTVYSYVVWVVATVRAWSRLARRRSGWTKTPRVPGATVGVGADA